MSTDKGMWFQADFWEAASVLPKRDRDALVAAIVEYGFTGEAPKLKPTLLAVFIGIKSRIDRSNERRLSGSKGGRNTQAKRKQLEVSSADSFEANGVANAKLSIKRESESKSKETSPNGEVKKAAQKFEPPTEGEVAAYAAERGLDVEPTRFCDYYSAQGWRLSNGVAMKDWKAAARNWDARGRKEGRHEVDLGAYAGAW